MAANYGKRLPANYKSAVTRLAREAKVESKEANRVLAILSSYAAEGQVPATFIKILLGSEVAGGRGASAAGNNACGGGSNACGGSVRGVQT